MKKTIKYLQGSDNNNFLGTIIGIKKIRSTKNPNPLAILLYFDQRTGRIERYLMNSVDKQALKINLDNESHHISDEHSFKKLNYGKLDSTFFNGFLLELFRDYLQTSYSYKICDMNYIRNYTLPLYAHDGSSERIGVGSGISIPNTIPLSGTKTFYANRYITLTNNKPHILNIPQYLNSYSNKVSLETLWNIKLNSYVIDSKSPQALNDLKVNFNSKTIVDLNTLNDQVVEFNNEMNDKLIKMSMSA